MMLAHGYTLRRDWPHLLAVFLLVAAVYVWSMPRSVVLEDDGYFILAAYYNAVTHPPGYPLFVLISHLFTYLPVGTVAFRVHMASACFGALACMTLWILMRHLLADRLCAYVAALGLGVSAVFWSQAIIAEVYTLNVLLFLSLLVLALQCTMSTGRAQDTCFKWLVFIYGLSLSNHWPLILLSTPALMLLLWPVKARIINRIILYLPFLFAGLLPYVWLIWRSRVVPAVSFYGPVSSWQEFWFFVSRKHYASVDHSITAGWLDKLQFAGFTIDQTIEQFGLMGVWFALIGLAWLWIDRRRTLFMVTIVAYLCNTLLLILLLGFDYDYFYRALFMVYPLIAYSMVAIWMACGIKCALVLAEKTHCRTFLSRPVVLALAVLVVGGALIANTPNNFRKYDLLASDYARVILDSLDPNAIYFANADNLDGPVEYMNKVEKVRPDVTVFTGRALIADGRLYRPYQLHVNDLNALITRVILGADRPVYYTNDFPNKFARDRYGLYTKINKERDANDKDMIMLGPRFIDFLKRWDQKHLLVNTWDLMHYNLVRADFCELVLNAEYSDKKDKNAMILAGAAAFTCDNYQGVLRRLKYAFLDPAATAAAQESLLEKAELYKDQAFTKDEMSRLEYYRGLYYLRLGDKLLAKNSFATSFKKWPHPDNQSMILLESLR